MKLVTDSATIADFLGFAPRERFLVPNTALDARHVSFPPLLEVEGRLRIFLEEIERGSVLGARLAPRIDPAYYAPYFRWEPTERSEIPLTIGEALRLAAGSSAVELDPFASLFLARLLPRIRIDDRLAAPWVGRGWVREMVSTSEVEKRFSATREAALEAAKRAAIGDRDEVRLQAAIERQPPIDRFATLDSNLEELGVEAILVASPLNVQELTGQPAFGGEGEVFAVYERGSSTVELVRSAATAGHSAQLLEIGRWLKGRRFGVEEQYLSVGQALAFGLEVEAGVPSSDRLRSWRERLSSLDIPYFVLAAKITSAGVGAALRAVEKAVRTSEMTELDVARTLAKEYETAWLRLDRTQAFRVRPAHINIHAGSRTTLPALPTDYRMGPGETSLKIDSGIFLMDADGLVRAATDMGRTFVQGETGETMYGVLERAVLHSGVPATSAGATGRGVFLATTGALDAERETIRRTGLGPSVRSFVEAYARYVGHTMDTQRYVSMHFTAASEERLEWGMTGSIELPWAWGPYGLQYEDVFLVDDQRGLNLTADEPRS